MIVKKRHPLSSKEQKELLEKVRQQYARIYEKMDRKKAIEVIETAKGETIYLQEGRPLLFNVSNKVVPCLRASQEVLEALPKVVVDMGAVSHIVNGADVMSPGIRGVVGEASVGGVVVIVEEKYGKPLAIGTLLMDLKDIRDKKRGKAVKNLHHVGDELWNFTETRM